MTPLARDCWSRLALSLSTDGLQTLARALRADDPRLTQTPDEGLDAVAFALRHGDGIEDWDTLRESWQRHFHQADGTTPAGQDPLSWHFFAWWDFYPREVVFAELASVIEVELERRARRGEMVVSLC